MKNLSARFCIELEKYTSGQAKQRGVIASAVSNVMCINGPTFGKWLLPVDCGTFFFFLIFFLSLKTIGYHKVKIIAVLVFLRQKNKRRNRLPKFWKIDSKGL